MKKVYFLALLASTFIGATASSAQIYSYQFEVKNSWGDTWGSDLPKSLLQRIHKINGQTKSCVNFKDVGSNSRGSLLEHGTIKYLTSTPISYEDRRNLEEFICNENVPSRETIAKYFGTTDLPADKVCSVQIYEKSYSLDKLVVVAVERSGEHSHHLSEKLKYFPLSGQQSVPQLSEVCQSGDHNDAVSYGKITAEGKVFFEKIGLDLEKYDPASLLELDVISNF